MVNVWKGKVLELFSTFVSTIHLLRTWIALGFLQVHLLRPQRWQAGQPRHRPLGEKWGPLRPLNASDLKVRVIHMFKNKPYHFSLGTVENVVIDFWRDFHLFSNCKIHLTLWARSTGKAAAVLPFRNYSGVSKVKDPELSICGNLRQRKSFPSI